MKLIAIGPTKDGQESELRILMNAEEIAKFLQVIRDGRLSEFGISSASVELSDSVDPLSLDRSHATRAERRNLPKDNTNGPSR